jgi:hypothetical protein
MAGPLDLRGTASVKNDASGTLNQIKKDMQGVADASKGLGSASADLGKNMTGSLQQMRNEAQKAAQTINTSFGSIAQTAQRQFERIPRTMMGGSNFSLFEQAGRQAYRSYVKGFAALKEFDQNHGMMAGSVAASEAKRLGKKLFTSAGSVEQERKLWEIQAGLTPKDRDEMERRAEEISKAHPALTKAGTMRALGEIRMPLGDVHGAHHAMGVIEPLAQAQSVLTNLVQLGKLSGVDAHHASFDFVKALELRGSTTAKDFEIGLEGMMKGIIASGGALNPLDWHMVSKSMRGALGSTSEQEDGKRLSKGLNDEFLYYKLPTLMQEFKAGYGGTATQAGSGLLSLYRSVVGGRMTERAIGLMQDIDMIEPGKYVKGKGGRPGYLKPGGVRGSDVFMHDPDAWVNDILKPHLEAKGITGDAQKQYIAGLFSNQVSEQIVGVLLAQHQRIAREAENMHGIKSNAELETLLGNAPVQATTELQSQLTNLLAALGDPLMPAAISGLQGLTSAIKSFTSLGQSSPGAAWGLGALGTAGLVVGGIGAASLLSRIPGGRMILGGALGLGLGGGVGTAAVGGILAQQAFGGAAIGGSLMAAGRSGWLGPLGKYAGGFGLGALALQGITSGDAQSGLIGAGLGAAGIARAVGMRFVPGVGWIMVAGSAIGAGVEAGKTAWNGGSWSDIGKSALTGAITMGMGGSGMPGSSAKASEFNAAGGLSNQPGLVMMGEQAQEAQAQVGTATQSMAADLAGLGEQMRSALASIDLSADGQRIMETLAAGLRSGIGSAVSAVDEAGAQISAAASRIQLNTGPAMMGHQ